MEELKFKITLDSEHHDFQKKLPYYKVILNNKVMKEGEIAEETIIEFEAECNENNTLQIEFLGKTVHDIILGDDGLPEKNKLLIIKSIEIDDIDVNHMIYTMSEYYPNDMWYTNQSRDTHPIPIQYCIDLGWNGEWKFKFNTPFYIFLLESL